MGGGGGVCVYVCVCVWGVNTRRMGASRGRTKGTHVCPFSQDNSEGGLGSPYLFPTDARAGGGPEWPPFLKVKNGAAPYSVRLSCPILVWQTTEYTAHSAKQTVIGIAAMAPGGKSGPHRHHTRPHRRFVWGTKPPKARGHGSPGTRVPMVTMPHVPHTCRARNECRRPGCGPPFGKRTAAIELGRPCRHHRYRVCSARGRHSICRLLSANAAAFRAAGHPSGGTFQSTRRTE